MKRALLGLIPALMLSTSLPAMAEPLTLDNMSDATRNKLIRNCDAHSNASGTTPAICRALEAYQEEHGDDSGEGEDDADGEDEDDDDSNRGKGNNNGKAKGHGKDAAKNGKDKDKDKGGDDDDDDDSGDDSDDESDS
jgi:hypothetical protein